MCLCSKWAGWFRPECSALVPPVVEWWTRKGKQRDTLVSSVNVRLCERRLNFLFTIRIPFCVGFCGSSVFRSSFALAKFARFANLLTIVSSCVNHFDHLYELVFCCRCDGTIANWRQLFLLLPAVPFALRKFLTLRLFLQFLWIKFFHNRSPVGFRNFSLVVCFVSSFSATLFHLFSQQAIVADWKNKPFLGRSKPHVRFDHLLPVKC